MTKNPEVRFAKSMSYYIFRWMATKFLSTEAQFNAGVNLRDRGAEAAGAAPVVAAAPPKPGPPNSPRFSTGDAPPCSTCGSLMIRSGSCYKCTNCGTTSGCASQGQGEGEG